MKSLRDNWAVLTGLAALCFFSGGAWWQLRTMGENIQDMKAQMEKFQSEYVTRSEVVLMNQALMQRVSLLEAQRANATSTH